MKKCGSTIHSKQSALRKIASCRRVVTLHSQIAERQAVSVSINAASNLDLCQEFHDLISW